MEYNNYEEMHDRDVSNLIIDSELVYSESKYDSKSPEAFTSFHAS